MSQELTDPGILNYLKSQNSFTMATSRDNIPYCAICFFAYQKEHNLVIFKSDSKTRHILEATGNSLVAGAISSGETDLKKIKGLQFEGRFLSPEEKDMESLKRTYYAKFPFARLFPGDIWAIELLKVKFTDNTFGFGKKLSWEKQA